MLQHWLITHMLMKPPVLLLLLLLLLLTCRRAVQMTFSVAAASNSGTEDLRGVVFDVTLPAGGLDGLTVGDVTKQPLTAAAAAGQKLSTAAIFKQVNINKIGDNQGMVDPGFTIAGTSGGQGQVNEPYDVGEPLVLHMSIQCKHDLLTLCHPSCARPVDVRGYDAGRINMRHESLCCNMHDAALKSLTCSC